ncbi:CAP domain-containing protein [Dethiobacter alkaliphilus]|uniref:CAP domain-containing protein n=1 Tax=Dethiobacter alkaliphilus TaxID=427926 RepID=UPI002227B0DF|nr:CAP domain-containing protein [Dethiobacter alkaliphilus]MCW3490916.1 CAP domain-containing protein [Dethiobacter alkaliphilus]
MRELINGERRQAGLPPVLLDEALCELAAIKAKDMRDNGYFGHRSDGLGTMPELVEASLGSCSRIGENLAMNFPDESSVHRAWMSSAMHRKNILDEGYQRFGFSWVEMGEKGRIYVQVFTGEQ